MKKHLKHLAFVKYIARRFYYARKRKKALAIVILIGINCLVTQLYAHIWIYPNTYLGGRSVVGSTARTIDTYLDSLITRPYTVRVGNREYTYTYKDLGVVIDHEAVLSALYAPNRRQFPLNIIALIPSLFIPRHIPIPLVYTQGFYQFTRQTIFDFGETADVVVFDQHTQSLEYVENEEKYRIEDAAFETLLTSRVENNSIPLYPKLVRLTNEKAQTTRDIAERIKSIFLHPLTVYVDTGGRTKSFVLTERELADIARVIWSQEQSDASISLNSTIAMYAINEHVKKAGILARGNVANQRVLRDLEDTLTDRFNGRQTDAMAIQYDMGPNSDGRVAIAYIEVDISQQKMYLFRNNKLYKTYRVSTGLEYPTPVGTFTILNKAGLGYSNIYNVWMPWWMGFSYSEELHAYFGIHEVPYKLTEDNKKHQASNATFIGTPNTGGCVALGVGDAQEVYRFADIGTKVVIYQ